MRSIARASRALRTNKLVFSLLVALLPVFAFAEEPDAPEPKGWGDGLNELQPTWAAGLEWSVHAHPATFKARKRGDEGEMLQRDKSRTIVTRFRVKGLKDHAGVACWEVAVSSDYRPDDDILFLVRQQDFSVKEMRITDKASKSTSTVTNERTPFVWLENSPLCPFDVPFFPKETKDEEKPFDLPEGGKLVQKVTIKKAEGEATVEMKTKWRGQDLVVRQEWKKGLPFWSKEVRLLDGKESETGELDEKSIKHAKTPK